MGGHTQTNHPSLKAMIIFLWFMLLAHTGLVSPAAPSQGKNIFILAGQSNMSGRGGVTNGTWDGYVPPESRYNPTILRLNAELIWVEGHEPLHKDIDVNRTCGIGLGMAFANSLLDKGSSLGVIGLVPCAIGGTKISEWSSGTSLYKQLVMRTKMALKGGGTIQAILWYQGESDTVNFEDAVLYKGRLEKFFTDLRADLQSPLLPIIQVALASGEGPYIDKVRQAQLGTALANVNCVDAKGLQLKSDHLHLTTTAEVLLGEMLADTFLHTFSTSFQNNNASKKSHNSVYDLFHSPPT